MSKGKRIKTVEVLPFGLKLTQDLSSSVDVRIAAENLAEAILKYKYPMIPNPQFIHKWGEGAIWSRIDAPSIVQYVEPDTGYGYDRD